MIVPWDNLSHCSPRNMVLFKKNCSWTTNLNFFLLNDNLFSFVLFMDEEENSRKGLNLGPLNHKGDSNYFISFFPLKIM
jgi:uncharacterized protein YpiB (UPF0302 family)